MNNNFKDSFEKAAFIIPKEITHHVNLSPKDLKAITDAIASGADKMKPAIGPKTILGAAFLAGIGLAAANKVSEKGYALMGKLAPHEQMNLTPQFPKEANIAMGAGRFIRQGKVLLHKGKKMLKRVTSAVPNPVAGAQNQGSNLKLNLATEAGMLKRDPFMGGRFQNVQDQWNKLSPGIQNTAKGVGGVAMAGGAYKAFSGPQQQPQQQYRSY